MKSLLAYNLGFVPLLFVPAHADQWGQLQLAPMPTAPPHPRDVLNAVKRFTADDNATCFFVNSDPASALRCATGSVCAHYAPFDVFGCCASSTSASSIVVNEDSCDIQSACVEQKDASDTNHLTEYTLYCAQSAAPSCVKYTWSTASAWVCSTTHTTITVGTSATGNPVIAPGITMGYISPPTSTLLPTGSSSLSPSSSGSTSASPSTNSPVAAAGSSNSTTQSESSGSQLSTGAIVGIAVGCTAAGVALIAVLGFCLWRRHKNKQRDAATIRPGQTGNGYSAGQPLMSGGYPQKVTDVSPLSPANLDAHLAGQWNGVKPDVAQRQTATRIDDDGLGDRPELRPEDAAGEPARYGPGGQSVIYSEAGRTALHPASESLWPQRA